MTFRGAAQDDERSRLRAGLVVLMVGLFVLLAAVAMAILRSPDRAQIDSTPKPQAEQSLLAGAALPILATLGIILVVVLLLVSYALLRITRNLAVPTRVPKKPSPTPTDDVWQQHKLPEEGLNRGDPSPEAD